MFYESYENELNFLFLRFLSFPGAVWPVPLEEGFLLQPVWDYLWRGCLVHKWRWWHSYLWSTSLSGIWLHIQPIRLVGDQWIFSQITQKFDDVLALASAPRPELPNRIFFDHNSGLSGDVERLFYCERIKSSFRNVLRLSTNDFRHFGITSYTDVFHHCGIASYTDALHIILGLFQDQPLSLKFLGMKKVCELDLEVKELPEELQSKAEKVTFWL